MPSNCEWITPDWSAPKNVRALCTLRSPGLSEGLYQGLNLACHVGDSQEAVLANRQCLRRAVSMPNEPHWLQQVHGTHVVFAEHHQENPQADACVTFHPERVCAVLTADCLPLLVCNQSGTKAAAIHAGWRGLAKGIIETTLEALAEDPSDLLVWLGPAIGPEAFEVGDEVFEAFGQPEEGFKRHRDRWLADLYTLARNRLKNIGVSKIWGGEHCTYRDERFYSHRRSNPTGRMGSLIWIEKT